jgi:CRP-like cAMP-binding protein
MSQPIREKKVIVADPRECRTRVDLRTEILRRSTIFRCLDTEQLAEIAPCATFHRFLRDEFVFHQGDPASFLYIVASGKVKQFKQSLSGKSFTTAILSSGDTLNAVALYGSPAFFVSAQAMNETTLLRITRADFLAFVGKYPIVTERLVALLGRVLNSAWERLTDFVGELVCQRIFNVLYMLHGKFGDAVPITKEELADMVGTTTETAIRVLGKPKKLGIIASGRGQIRILNKAKLGSVSRRSYVIRQQESNGEGMGTTPESTS